MASAARDRCIAPIPAPMETLETVRKEPVFSNYPQKSLDSVNLTNQLMGCLSREAFLARTISGSIDDVAKAISARCNPQVARSAEIIALGSNAPSEESFNLNIERVSRAEVLQYRECANGGGS